MVIKTVVTSNISYQDAAAKARQNGFTVIGKARNKKGHYVVFVRK